MTDDRTEQAFRTALATRAAAYEPSTLVPPSPARWRRWPALVAVAALVLGVVGAGLVVRAVHHGDAAPAELPDGWRWESYRNVLVGVPADWGQAYAPNDQWCTSFDSDVTPEESGLPLQGYVDLAGPDAFSTDVKCTSDIPPESLFVVHLTFLGTGDPPPVPVGWTNVTRSVAGVRLDVVTDDARRALADRILATAHVSDIDANGCTATSPVQARHAVRPPDAFDVTLLDDVDSITVCQYALLGTDAPGLRASRVLTGAAADAELQALEAAPTGGGPDRPRSCTPEGWGENGLVLRLSAGSETHEMYGYYSWCSGNGFDDGTALRQITRADCSPLFGGRVQMVEADTDVGLRCEPPRQ